jgi:hypothetical protein
VARNDEVEEEVVGAGSLDEAEDGGDLVDLPDEEDFGGRPVLAVGRAAQEDRAAAAVQRFAGRTAVSGGSLVNLDLAVLTDC